MEDLKYWDAYFEKQAARGKKLLQSSNNQLGGSNEKKIAETTVNYISPAQQTVNMVKARLKINKVGPPERKKTKHKKSQQQKKRSTKKGRTKKKSAPPKNSKTTRRKVKKNKKLKSKTQRKKKQKRKIVRRKKSTKKQGETIFS
jgi:hypothetical protein